MPSVISVICCIAEIRLFEILCASQQVAAASTRGVLAFGRNGHAKKAFVSMIHSSIVICLGVLSGSMCPPACSTIFGKISAPGARYLHTMMNECIVGMRKESHFSDFIHFLAPWMKRFRARNSNASSSS